MTNLEMVHARFARNEGLPFADVLTKANILEVLNDHGVKYRDRVFSPVTTIWGFLSQVLSEDHSCRDTVLRIIAHRAASGVTVCSPNTASYCNARGRILTGVGSRTVESRPDGEIIVWRRPNKPRGMSGEQYRSYPETLTMRQVSVDARGSNNRAEQFKVVTTILTASISGDQIGELYERRWDGEVDIRSIKSTMKMEILRCKTPEMVRKEIWTHLLAYNLLRTVIAVAASENAVEPRAISFKGAKQALTAFAPKLEAARPEQRARLVDAMLKAVAYHRVGNRPGRWEPRARKRRPKPGARLMQPRREAKLARNRAKWY